MHPTSLLLYATALLAAPWLLRPRTGGKPEVRGYRRVLWWINRAYCLLWHRLESPSMAPLPEHGPAILIANHTSGLDPLLLQATSQRVLAFLIAREFYEHRIFHPICRVLGCIPVRRDGHDFAATRAALRALDDGRVIPIFPEGRINPTSGKTLLEPKPGVAFIVQHARVPVIPAFICGTPATNHVVKALVTPSRARVVYGEPIDPAEFAVGGTVDKEHLTAVAARLMSAIHALQERTRDEESRGEVFREGTTDAGPVGRRTRDRTGALSSDRAALRGA
jgi:1-acyl-sn-glycerol-3-phosphate acyltransferase